MPTDTDYSGEKGLSPQQQIIDLGKKMEKGFERIEALLHGFDDRLRTMENREAACQPAIQIRLDSAWREIERLKNQIDIVEKLGEEREKKISGLMLQMRITAWVGGLAGSALIIDFVSRVIGK